jgi:hypothetical protein
MPPFDPQYVAAALAEIPTWATDRIRDILKRAAKDKKIPVLVVDACESELAIRGAMPPLSADDAAAAHKLSTTLDGKSLEEVIELAFKYRAADADEIWAIRWIAAHPGASYQEAEKAYGRRDLSLLVGHLVYYRFGHFRSFIPSVKRQSDLLIDRTTPKGKTIHYTLRPEATSAFHRLGLLN